MYFLSKITKSEPKFNRPFHGEYNEKRMVALAIQTNEELENSHSNSNITILFSFHKGITEAHF